MIPLSVRTDFTRRGLKNTKMEFLVVYLGYNLEEYHKYRLKKEKSTQSKGLLKLKKYVLSNKIKKYIKIRLHLAKIAEDVFFIRKTKEKEAKRNEIKLLKKNYFVTVSFIFVNKMDIIYMY